MQRKSRGLIGDLKCSGNGNSDNHQVLFLNQASFKVLFLQVLSTICHFINVPWKKKKLLKYICIQFCMATLLTICVVINCASMPPSFHA